MRKHIFSGMPALAKATFKERTITSQPLHGKKTRSRRRLTSPGCWNSNGVFATVTMSFDTYAHHQPMLEVMESTARLIAPDPNTFGGTVWIWTPSWDWEKEALTHSDKTSAESAWPTWRTRFRSNVPTG